MQSHLVRLDISPSADDLNDYMEWFEIWYMTRKDIKYDEFITYFLKFILT